MKRRPSERGAALLTVLLLVAVMAVVSATAVERLTLATRLAGSSNAAGQARQAQIAAEALAVQRITTVTGANPYQTTLQGDWLNKPFTAPLPGGGSAEIRVSDGGNCFNLNSLIQTYPDRPAVQRTSAIEQFVTLMRALGIAHHDAQLIAFNTADWIDPDNSNPSGGSEDALYAGGPAPYRAANMPMSDPGELTAVSGVTPAIWAKVEPWVCALPTHSLSPINVNTLLPEQAPLAQMLIPGGIEPARARNEITNRPAGGFGRTERFWQAIASPGYTPDEAVLQSVGLKTRWFLLRTRIRLGDGDYQWVSLVDAGDGTTPARVVRRKWGPES